MKRFKYLYFTNILNKPYFNFWFLKKLKGGEEDDGNLLSQPSNFSDSGIDWTWDKMNVTGKGTLQQSPSKMCGVLDLKHPLETHVYYTFSTRDALPAKRQITLKVSDDDGHSVSKNIMQGQTSIKFSVSLEFNHFQLLFNSKRNEQIDDTFYDLKLVKDET